MDLFSNSFMKKEAERLSLVKHSPCVPKPNKKSSKILKGLKFTHEESQCEFDLPNIWVCALLFC